MSQNISHKIRQFDEIYIYIAISLEKFVKLHQVNLTRYFYIAMTLEKFVKLYKVNLTSYFQTSQFFKYETFSRFFTGYLRLILKLQTFQFIAEVSRP